MCEGVFWRRKIRQCFQIKYGVDWAISKGPHSRVVCCYSSCVMQKFYLKKCFLLLWCCTFPKSNPQPAEVHRWQLPVSLTHRDSFLISFLSTVPLCSIHAWERNGILQYQVNLTLAWGVLWKDYLCLKACQLISKLPLERADSCWVVWFRGFFCVMVQIQEQWHPIEYRGIYEF